MLELFFVGNAVLFGGAETAVSDRGLPVRATKEYCVVVQMRLVRIVVCTSEISTHHVIGFHSTSRRVQQDLTMRGEGRNATPPGGCTRHPKLFYY